jgi:hypothetical protein
MHGSKISIIIAIAISLVVLQQIALADVIMPGYHYASITNRITNMVDLSDYVIISCDSNWLSTCPVRVISQNGTIPDCYKFSSVKVYGISSQAFSNSIISMNSTNLNAYLGANGQLLAEDIIQSLQVNDSAQDPNPTMEFALSIGNVVRPDYTNHTTPVVCTMEARSCPDGSFVGRGYNGTCEFYPCPATEQQQDGGWSPITKVYASIAISAVALIPIVYLIRKKRKVNA